MTRDASKEQAERTCAAEVSQSDVDAGADLTVKIRVTSPDDFDLVGQPVSIRGADNNEFASAELTETDDAVFAAEVSLGAPVAIGEHTWQAVLPAVEDDDTIFDETAATFSFVVRAHIASVQVWGMPSAIPAGERFRMKVGVKCTSACNLAGRLVAIVDQGGAEAATGLLREAPSPGTTALYVTEIEATAPASVGSHEWRATTPASASGLPHAAGELAFAIKVVGVPDYEITIEAFDQDKGTPIKGLHVLLHPYRALTGDDGIVRIKVVRGSYKLYISGLKYIPYEDIIDATGDVTLRALLALEPKKDSYLTDVL
jgi:hypothetical protein